MASQTACSFACAKLWPRILVPSWAMWAPSWSFVGASLGQTSWVMWGQRRVAVGYVAPMPPLRSKPIFDDFSTIFRQWKCHLSQLWRGRGGKGHIPVICQHPHRTPHATPDPERGRRTPLLIPPAESGEVYVIEESGYRTLMPEGSCFGTSLVQVAASCFHIFTYFHTSFFTTWPVCHPHL